MLRSALWTLQQPRYAALAALMLVIALGCTAAGTWQISRLDQSVHVNHAIDRNAHTAAVPLTTTLVPLVNHGPSPSREAIRYRTVTASGTYLTGTQQFVRKQFLNGKSGYDVLNPLRTAAGVLLVVRGFVAAAGNGDPPATITAPPSGLVHIEGRLQTAATRNGRENSDGEVSAVSPADQSARLHAPVYNAYLTLVGGQPGTSGVSVLPAPDLSNPAGGAVEPQHLAYVIQWYVFALLALAAPFAISRSEVRDAQRRFLGIDPGNEQIGSEPVTGQPQALQLNAAPSAGVATRADNSTLQRAGQSTTQRWRRAARLADRYGRSVGIENAEPADAPSPAAPAGGVRTAAVGRSVPSSADHPHRSHDSYHGSYNDYLWELALADGTTQSISIPRIPDRAEPDAAARRRLTVKANGKADSPSPTHRDAPSAPATDDPASHRSTSSERTA